MSECQSHLLYGFRVNEQEKEALEIALTGLPQTGEHKLEIIEISDECDDPVFLGVELPSGNRGSYGGFDLDSKAVIEGFQTNFALLPEELKKQLTKEPITEVPKDMLETLEKRLLRYPEHARVETLRAMKVGMLRKLNDTAPMFRNIPWSY